MKTFTLTTLFCLLGISTLSAQNPSTDDLIRGFFEVYEMDKPGEAIDLLYSTNSPEWLAQIQSSIDNVKAKFQDLNSIVGAYYGKEKLGEEMLGSCFKTVIYQVRYDRQPIRFTFQYYMPQDKWRLYSFSYDDKLPADHEETVNEKLIKQ